MLLASVAGGKAGRGSQHGYERNGRRVRTGLFSPLDGAAVVMDGCRRAFAFDLHQGQRLRMIFFPSPF